jgi:MFS family permease
VYGLIESSRLGFGDVRIAGALSVGVVLLVAFAIVEWRSVQPMMPLSLFRSRAFTGANLLTLFLYGALAGGLFFVPMNLIQLQGFSATGAGAAMLPSVLILFALSRWSGGLVDRIGARLPLIAGPAIAAAGFALFMVPGTEANYWTTFFPAAVVLGFGMALTVAPLTTTVMSSVDRSRSGVASGVNNAVSETAGVLAIAVFGLAMAQVFAAKLDDKLAAARVPAEIRDEVVAQRTKLAAIEIPQRANAGQRQATKAAVDESFVAAFRCAMLIAAVLGVLSALAAAICIAPEREGKS